MDFYNVLERVLILLQRHGRVSYRALKRQFDLDDASLDDLKFEISKVQQLAADQDGAMLIWTGSPMPSDARDRYSGEPEGRFHALLPDVIARLQRDRRVSYRTIKYVFGLDDALLAEICEELTFRRLAMDEDAKGLVWTQPHATATDTPTHEPPTALEDAPGAPPSDDQMNAAHLARSAPEAERRQLTVMFCDLVGSTDLSGRLDPEDLREVVRAYQETAAAVIKRYEGHIAQYLGDGLLIYFGYPVAHEDDAQRAVYTGLGIIEAMETLNLRLQENHRVELAVRIGIHTGPVVVGEIGGGGRRENLALGETPNIAARLEGIAPPNTAIVSSVTAQLVQRTFVLEELGSQELKGVAEPMRLYAVVSPRESEYDDHEDMHAGGFDALVGRDEEIGLMLRRWEQSKTGLGQVALLSGEAGIGKSSLVEGLRAHAQEEGMRRTAFRCSPYHTHSALHPMIERVQRALGWQADDAADRKLAKLEQGLEDAGLTLNEAVPLLASLLSLPLPEERYPPLRLSPQQQRQQTQDLLVAWLLEEAERAPLLAVWEDLHWADASTLEVLGLCIDQAPTATIMHVLTFRPEFVPPWPMRSHLTPLTLNRLERLQVEALIMRLASSKALPPDVVDHIVVKTDGVPLYVEELTKMLLESNLLQEADNHYELTGPLTSVTIPDTLQDSLMARLDQLQQGKEVAQLGAILGRAFDYEMLRAIAARDDATLQADLAELVEAELLYQRGRPPRATYIFKHALIQDAAYASLLRSTRQHVHQQVARLLETQFSDVVETQPELVAYHHTEAGHFELAQLYWQQAGQHAIQQFAYREAVSHFEAALAALAQLPEDNATMTQSIDLKLQLNFALLPLDEYDQMFDLLRDAERLAEALSDYGRMGRIVYGMAPLFYRRADYEHTIAACQRVITLTERGEDTALWARAHTWLGYSYYALGDYRQARTLLRRAVTTADEFGDNQYGGLHYLSVTSRSQLTRILSESGAFREGQAYGEECLRNAEATGHLSGEILARESLGFLFLFKGDFECALAVLERSLDQRRTISFRGYEYASSLASLGYAYARCGHVAKGLPLLEQATEQSPRSLFVIWLSEAHILDGRLAEARTLADRALDVAQKQQERGWEALVRRLFGDLALHGESPDLETSETHYRQSLRLADELGMRPLQAHCHRDLGKLYSRTGQAEQARAELSAAIEMYRGMDMTFWLPETEAALAKLEDKA